MSRSSHRAWIALGSNLGDRRETLNSALIDLERTAGLVVTAVSSFWETPPIGGPLGQGAFLNAAAEASTTLSPHELRLSLVEVERKAGRVRKARWGERTLDLDVLFYGDGLILQTDELIIPHPRLGFRRFVLEPLAEIAPDLVDPVTGRSIAQLLAALDRRPRVLALACAGDWPWAEGGRGAHRLMDSLNADIVDVADHWRIDDQREPILIACLLPSASTLWGLEPRLRVLKLFDIDDSEHRADRIGWMPPHPRETPIVWAKSDSPDAAEAEIIAACRAGDRIGGPADS